MNNEYTYSIYYRGEVPYVGLGVEDAYDAIADVGPGSVLREHRADGKILDSWPYEELYSRGEV